MAGTLDTSIITPAEASAIAQAEFDNATDNLPFAKILPMKSNGGDTRVPWKVNVKPKQHVMEFRAWDAEAKLGKTEGESAGLYVDLLPLSKRMRVTEQDQIRGFRSDPAFLKNILTSYFQQLGAEAAYKLELARVQELLTGKLLIEENKGSYDFKRKTAQTVTLAADKKWSVDGTDPIKDILDWIDLVKKAEGYRPGAIITSNEVLISLTTNRKLIEYSYGRGETTDLPLRISDEEVLNVLRKFAHVNEILLADDAYTALGKDLTEFGQFYPSNSFLLVPSLNSNLLGFTADGPTVEADDATYATGKSENSGLIGAVMTSTAPPAYEAYVNGSALPVLQQANSTVAATVI
jgi:hypothetical protein